MDICVEEGGLILFEFNILMGCGKKWKNMWEKGSMICNVFFNSCIYVVFEAIHVVQKT